MISMCILHYKYTFISTFWWVRRYPSRHFHVLKIFRQVKREVGDVSILVNNAGMVTGKYTFIEAPDNLVDRTLRVNVAAHFWVRKSHSVFSSQCTFLIPLFLCYGNSELTVISKTSRYLHSQTYKAFLPAMMQRNHGHLVCVACHGGLFAMNSLAGTFITGFQRHCHCATLNHECAIS